MSKNLLIVFLVFSCLSHGQSLFKQIDLVDEFGDKTGTAFANITHGTFSNTATSDSKLLVKAILNPSHGYNLDEYKAYLKEEYDKYGYSEKQIKQGLKYANKSLDAANNLKGTITFKLYEYGDHLANIDGDEYGQLSIKLADGKKIRTLMGLSSFHGGDVVIIGYKEKTKGMSGVENMIKYGTYYWEQTEIYDSIVNSDEPIEVVISLKNSTYKFTLERP
ncbi:hypothetical protein K1F50_14540 [Muricauda oceani]|uniref:Uncharacterized protein n=1 Tax=Flagellimonas oceani TaxID=2698672 RepID=A0A6G7J2V5_9FLAO|nr:hypothetical protein [Allomuricauda oceani]MBW8244023.1 hypothetical protein [Allomuricauda oceani]QII45000.1 hypothetical protein GVT53_10000 [Allomuricauda oceani]